jgi:3',5'-cyclic AMP phosphodiesterase CpdA
MRKKLVFAAAFAALAATAQWIAAAEKVVGGPFVVGVTGKTAKVAWIVQADEVSLKPASGATITAPTLRVETTSFTSLQPNTRYEYNIASMGDGGKGSFKTPPAGAEPFSFVVYGDNRTRHDVHRQVITQILKRSIPDFIVQTGDMVADGNDSAQWPVFFDIEKELLRQTAFFPALGNHERNTHYFADLFHSTPYYSFDWGNAHFSVIDSNISDVADYERGQSIFWNEQVRWLEEDLAAHQKSEFRFLVAHHPPFTAVASRQGTNGHMTALTPMLEKYHVNAAFFGHDHNYQHYVKNGIHYVTTGGGGAPLYDVSKPAPGITVKVVSIENFVNVSVKGKSAQFQAIAIDGKVLDDFGVEAGTVH